MMISLFSVSSLRAVLSSSVRLSSTCFWFGCKISIKLQMLFTSWFCVKIGLFDLFLCIDSSLCSWSQKTSLIFTFLVKSFKSLLKSVLGVVTGANFGPLVSSEVCRLAREKEDKLMSFKEAVEGVVVVGG